ncbi:hypothetical protein ES703_86633 [subsurface metagenome]
MPEELADAYRLLDHDDETRVVVVTGAGEHSAPSRQAHLASLDGLG